MATELKHNERFPTGVPGLDLVLKGGLVPGGIHLLMGRPGAGKTILANQIALHHIAAGGRALYVTLLTETHSRLFASLEQLAFFDLARVGEAITYLNGYQALEAEGLTGLLALLRKSLRSQKATLLVLDGLVTVTSLAESDLDVKRFLHKLQVLVELIGCTTLVLTGDEDSHSSYPQRTMVDGLLALSSKSLGMKTARELEVLKLRGGDCILGRHFFRISEAGVTVFPRTEALVGSSPPVEEDRLPLTFGVPKLDEMMAGGLLADSTTLLLGSPGSGKTVLGLNFLAAGARQQEPGLYFGFFESPARVASKGDHVSLGLSALIKQGRIEVIWRPPLEQTADELARVLLEAVQRRHVRRLFIDGFDGFRESIIHPERLPAFFTALSNELRSLGVTTVVSEETNDLFGPMIALPVANIAASVENIVFLRYVEVRSQLRRLVSIMKMREGSYDSSLREFSISDQGVNVSSTFESAEAILSGQARLQPEAPAQSRRKKTTRTPRRRRS